MAFTIYRSRRTVSGQAPGARANIDVRTGGQRVAQAVSGLGGAVADLGLRWDIMEASTQLNEAKMFSRQEHNRLMLELPGLEPPEHAKAYEESIKVQQGFTPKNKRAASAYEQLMNDFAPQWELDVKNATKAKLKDNKRAVGFVLQQGAIQDGQFKDYFTHLEEGKRLGVYDAEEVVKYKQATIDSNKRYVETQEAIAKREAAENLKLLQDKTNRQMLADLWDGKLKDPQKITDAVRVGLLTDIDGKYLRNALMSTEPPTLNLQSLAVVKQAIEEIGTNTKTKQQALSVLYAHLDSIDPTTGKTLVNEIYSAQDKNKSEMKRESRALMEELVRDRDKFTGMFTDDERQILAAAEAYLMLDAEIEKAAKEGKPLIRRDIMIKAIQIGRQMKKKIKAEKEKGTPPLFEPQPRLKRDLRLEGQLPPEPDTGMFDRLNKLRPLKIGDVPIPKTKREMINKLRELEKIDPALSAEYYNKYLDKFW